MNRDKQNTDKQSWHKPAAGPAERENRFVPELAETEESEGGWGRRVARAVLWIAVVTLALALAYWIRLHE